MADTRRGKLRRLGPFRLGSVHGDDDVLEFTRLGPIYEARNERTGAAAVVLVPGPNVRWKPTEDWTVRATCKPLGKEASGAANGGTLLGAGRCRASSRSHPT